MSRWRTILGALRAPEDLPPISPFPPEHTGPAVSGGIGGIGGRSLGANERPELRLIWNRDEGFSVTPEDAVALATGALPEDEGDDV